MVKFVVDFCSGVMLVGLFVLCDFLLDIVVVIFMCMWLWYML